MTEFVFQGLQGQDEITLREVTFEAGELVSVEDESLATKLRNLPYFEEVEEVDLDELRAEYESVLGEKPHHAMKSGTMKQRIADAQADD